MPQPQILQSKTHSTAKQKLLGQDQWCQLDPKGVPGMGSQLPKSQHSLDLTAMRERTPVHPETAITLETGSHTDHCSSEPRKEGRCLGNSHGSAGPDYLTAATSSQNPAIWAFLGPR